MRGLFGSSARIWVVVLIADWIEEDVELWRNDEDAVGRDGEPVGFLKGQWF